MLTDWLQGFTSLLTPETIAFLALGIVIGLFVGVLPGIGGTTALVLLTPLTFALEPIQALAVAGGIMGASAMGGAVTAILLNTPGQTSNAVTCLDGYPLAQSGRAGLAIGAAASSNALGGLIGVISVLAIMPVAGHIIMLFGPPEFFLLAVLGLVLVASTARGNTFRALITAAIGVALATIGYSDVSGSERYTFGNEYLWDGLHIPAALIGLFAVAEMSHLTVQGGSVAKSTAPIAITGLADGLMASIKNWGTLLRGSVIGTLVGAVPGVGGTVASFLSYGMTVQASKDPDSFGKGNIKGIIATEAAINAKDGSMLIPTLALGIPGSAEMAVFMGILVLHGMQPGPLMLMRNEVEIYALIWSLSLACTASSFIGLLLARPLAMLTRVDVQLLAPIIIAIGFVGSYAIDLSIENVFVTAAFGLIGYLMIQYRFPRLPLVIAMVLGSIAERSYQQSMMISDGDLLTHLQRPASAVLAIAIVLSLTLPYVGSVRRAIRGETTTKAPPPPTEEELGSQ